MKKTIFIAIFAALFATAAAAQVKKFESVYTSTSANVCRTVKQSSDGAGSYEGICPGVGGYKLELLEGDIRQTINVIAPGGKKSELELWTAVSSGFSSVGEKAEWRVRRSGKTVVPAALIVRFNASEDPADSSKVTSYLIVVKVAKTEACITDVVAPTAGQNEKARALADTAAARPCRVAE